MRKRRTGCIEGEVGHELFVGVSPCLLHTGSLPIPFTLCRNCLLLLIVVATWAVTWSIFLISHSKLITQYQSQWFSVGCFSHKSGMRSPCDNPATSCDRKVRSMDYTAIGTNRGALCLKVLFGAPPSTRNTEKESWSINLYVSRSSW